MTILDKLRAGVMTASADETSALATELAAELPPDATLALHGDLGVGKTTFVQGLARGLDVAEAVTSPTFTIFNIHRSNPALRSVGEAGRCPQRTLVHLDAYRLTGAAQLDALMLDDFLVTPYCLAIEWPDHIAAWLPPDALHLDLGIAPDETHTIRLR
jgi:tRNA threonylcarbamoyladenosine biosynthesis protein TsaE